MLARNIGSASNPKWKKDSNVFHLEGHGHEKDRPPKVLFDIDEMKDRQDVILEYYAKKRNLTEDEVQIEKAMVEQIKNEALVKP